jgi:hypothetical protein
MDVRPAKGYPITAPIITAGAQSTLDILLLYF